MNRIEEIKQRLERLNYFRQEIDRMIESHETGSKLWVSIDGFRDTEKLIHGYAAKDIEYLLSKLENCK